MNLPQLANGAARTLSQHLRHTLLNAVAVRAAQADTAPLVVAPARVPRAPALLADALPGSAAAREERRALFTRCLAHYRRAVSAEAGRGQGDDLGAAAAHFVLANLRALQGTDATPPQFQALQRQMAGVLRIGLADAGTREQQLHFEKFALLAVLMSETWTLALRQGPAAMAHVRQAAHGYLVELLGLEPQRLALGDQGLALRADVACAA
ncbi:DUF6683 family protein [Azohydromonas caseinilytica]|uniref:Uncharacterized protein n=1 Tax=Azohydromonas caseinilytica TaxID=2728836 RepID=A0A848FGE0_9BURK|nr:DUF6683 family protein [Azohydromonas caseinilytica]NML18518.1 hypothetical protein [Azohydromonas caseinilytica]